MCNVLFCLHIFSAFTAFPHDIGSVWDSAEHLLALLFQLRSSNRRRRVTDWIFSVLRGRTDGSKVNRSDACDWPGLNKTKWPHTVIHSFLYGAWHCKTNLPNHQEWLSWSWNGSVRSHRVDINFLFHWRWKPSSGSFTLFLTSFNYLAIRPVITITSCSRAV